MKHKKTNTPLLKECFFTALIRLMDQKDFQEITISEIAELAGVSRTTYYRTYDSKEDILLQYFDDRSKLFIKEITQEPELTPLQFSVLFFRSFKKQTHLIKYLYQANLTSDILKIFTEFIHLLYCELTNEKPSDPDIQYRIRFIAGGMYMMIIHWLESGQKETPEELAKISMTFLNNQFNLSSDNTSL